MANRKDVNKDMTLYIVKKTNDLLYLSSFNQTQEQINYVFTPIKSDALVLPWHEAETYRDTLNRIEKTKYEIIPSK